MNARILLGVFLVGSAFSAACGGEDAAPLRRSPGGPQRENGKGSSPGNPESNAPETGQLPAGSKAGETFFASQVFPLLKSECSGCHVAGGRGNPTWIDAGNPKKTYDMLYVQAYATAASRIVKKGLHDNNAAPALSTAAKEKWSQWIGIESKEPNRPAQANVLEKFGDCLDKAKFDAIGFGDLRVTRRRADNNPRGLEEDQQECTGCKDNTPCNRCHSADDVTGFVMALGNTIFYPDYTFEQTKLLSPPFIRQYVGTTPTGEPTYNPGIITKSTHTIEKAEAYAHPMFVVSDEMQAAIKAFVEDAIEKHKAGTCGK